MNATVIVIGDDSLDIALSSESIAADPSLAGAEVFRRPLSDPHPWSAAAGESLIFLRAGDRLLPGAVAAMLGALSDCGAAVGAHSLAGRGGWGTDVVPPALATLADLADVAVDVPFELSAIGARRSALPALLTPSPAAPGGEVALLCALLERARCRTIHDVVAQVRMRPVHHGDPEGVLERLRGVLHGPLGADEVVASRVRRRALCVAYLESPPTVAERFRPDEWWSPAGRSPEPARLLAIVRDVHWVAARLAEVRHVAEVGFDGIVAEAPADAVSVLPPDVNNILLTNESLHAMVAELSATVRWLHDEVRVRDESLAGTRVRGVPVEQTRSRELVRELFRRTRRHLRRLSPEGSAK
ncbi:MAG: hypothetical protein WC538_17575 [Thermoanaerobaculia bacterium]